MKLNTKAILARAEAATAGPWRYDDGHVFCGPLADARHAAVIADIEREPGARDMSRYEMDPRETVASCPQDNPDVSANEEFIAAARTDVPALCARVEALEKALRDVLSVQLVDALRGRLEAQARPPGRGVGEGGAAMKLDTKAILARAEAATAGPWRVSSTGYSVKSATDEMPIVASNPWFTAMRESQAEAWLDNAEFIAAARTDVPALCARVEQLKGALRACRRQMQNEWHNKPRIGMEAECAQADAALTAPDDDSALREFGLRCVALWEFGEATAAAASDDTRASMEQTVLAALRGGGR